MGAKRTIGPHPSRSANAAHSTRCSLSWPRHRPPGRLGVLGPAATQDNTTTRPRKRSTHKDIAQKKHHRTEQPQSRKAVRSRALLRVERSPPASPAATAASGRSGANGSSDGSGCSMVTAATGAGVEAAGAPNRRIRSNRSPVPPPGSWLQHSCAGAAAEAGRRCPAMRRGPGDGRLGPRSSSSAGAGPAAANAAACERPPPPPQRLGSGASQLTRVVNCCQLLTTVDNC